jgi:hypothetical protein
MGTMHTRAFVFLLILSLGTHLHAVDPPRVFRAGAATSNVTPDLGSSINGGFQDGKATYIHDELHARCLVLADHARIWCFTSPKTSVSRNSRPFWR